MKYLITLLVIAFVGIQVQAQTASNELLGFIKGNKEVFLSRGLQKANGLNIRMEYPSGWSTRDGKRPHVLQFFKSPNLFEMASISVYKVSEFYDLNQEELTLYADDIESQLMSNEMMRSLLIINDDTTIEEYKFSTTRLDALSAVMASCKVSTQGNANIGLIRMFTQTYLIVYKKSFIMFQYMIQQHSYESETAFNKRIDDYKPLFQLMANSIVFLN